MRMNKKSYLNDYNNKCTIKCSHYNYSQQDSGEMTLFLHCSTFLHELFWVFRIESIFKVKKKEYTS